MESIEMKQTSAELKRQARESLNGHWGLMIGATVLAMLILYGVMLVFYIPGAIAAALGSLIGIGICIIVMLLVSLATTVLMAGIVRMHMNLARGQEIRLGMMFSQFTNKPFRYILGGLLLAVIGIGCLAPGYICIMVGSASDQPFALIMGILLWLGGMIGYIVLAFNYALINYLFLDNPQMGVLEAYKESARMMKGNKGRMFYIFLSFIGWSVLAMLSCGIGMLWVAPYMAQTSVAFYLDIKDNGKQETIDWN